MICVLRTSPWSPRAERTRQTIVNKVVDGMVHTRTRKTGTDGAKPEPYNNCRMGRASTNIPTVTGNDHASRYLIDFDRTRWALASPVWWYFERTGHTLII